MKPFLIQKISDEGTADPFFARMMCQNLELRNFVMCGEVQIKEFDGLYEPLFNNLAECRQAFKECARLIDDHSRKISSGEIIEGQNNAWTVRESIAQELNRNFKDFFIKGRISLQCLDKLSAFMGYPIGFFFQKDPAFEKGLQSILGRGEDSRLKEFVKMLRDDRQWYALFREIRTEIEHNGFNLPMINYKIDSSGKGQVLIPTVNNQKIEDFLNVLWSNLFEFSEEVFVTLVDLKLTYPAMIVGIPEVERDPKMPIKYRIGVRKGK